MPSLSFYRTVSYINKTELLLQNSTDIFPQNDLIYVLVEAGTVPYDWYTPTWATSVQTHMPSKHNGKMLGPVIYNRLLLVVEC